MDGDASFSTGNAHLLFAVGAAEIAVFAVLKPDAEIFYLAVEGTYQLQEFHVLCPTLINTAGETAEQRHNYEYKSHPVENAPAGDDGDEIEDQIGDHQSDIQLVTAVTARHESAEKTANQYSPPPSSCIYNIIIYENAFVNGSSVNKM